MLDAFLEDMARRPFVDGEADCVLTVADWVVANGHPDPAAPFRGRYRTALGRERIVRREGGLLAVMEAGAKRSDLIETQTPERGDVGLIEMRGQQLAAIRQGRLWAIKSSRGLTAEPADRVIKAWSVMHG